MNAGDFRAGSIFLMEGSFYQVVESAHISQPRMAAFVRAKIKNLESGAVQEKRFNVGDHFADVDMERKEMQFLYNEGNVYYFMDPESFEQTPVNEVLVKDAMQYNTEGITYTFTSVNGKIISVTPPTFVVMTITECPPSVAGDTARNALKNATCESGITIKVPMFVNNGDKVKVDTRTGAYVERA
jgi:elongation factor P